MTLTDTQVTVYQKENKAMRKVWKKGSALALAAVMCAGILSGCGKQSEALSIYKFNGEKVDGDLVNFVLRHEQSSLDDIYAYYASMMQQDIWSMDDGQGLGITTWDNFKGQIGETVEKLLLAEEHAADYDVTLTDDEKKAITDAASKFISDNDPAALASMSATQEIVERYLTLSTIQAKVEKAMTADVDTNVSDEEAAQRTVAYIEYTPTTEAESEAESEAGAETEAETQSGNETEAEEENTAETEAQKMTEGETSPVETEKSSKTKAPDQEETETAKPQADTETEKDRTGADQALTEAEQAQTEGEGNLIEEESAVEDPAMAEARIRYREMADQQLEALSTGGIDFDAAVEQVKSENVPGVSSSTFTFGKDDTYPDAAIIEATNDLEDETLVDKIVEAGDSYYILYVKDAFDEDATQQKKESIVEERKTDKINEVYDKWIADEKFDVDMDKLDAILKDRNYGAPASNETEAAAADTASAGTASTETASTETELHLEVTVETEMEVETDSEA